MVGLRRDSIWQMPGGLGSCLATVASRWPKGAGSRPHGHGLEDALALAESGGQVSSLG
jgi:hypothetical protein